jgi:hypothetical protein
VTQKPRFARPGRAGIFFGTGWVSFLVSAIMFWAAPVCSQELYFAGGMVNDTHFRDRSYSWSLEYMQGLGENFAFSLSYLNEGHLPNNHRDGMSAQFWARKQVLDRRLSLAVGAGPYRYFDTEVASQGGSYSDSHDWGALMSASATWYTQSRWLGQIRVNWVKTPHSVDTLSGLVGIGYQLDAPLSEGPLDNAPSVSEEPFRNEISSMVGMTIQNNHESEKSVATSIEYRRSLFKYLDWTVAWIYEADNEIPRRNGAATQLWLVRSFFADRLALGFGAGPYVQIDDRSGVPGQGSDDRQVSALVSMTATYRFTPHWGTRLTWSRLSTNYNLDTDLILLGVCYRF